MQWWSGSERRWQVEQIGFAPSHRDLRSRQGSQASGILLRRRGPARSLRRSGPMFSGRYRHTDGREPELGQSDWVGTHATGAKWGARWDCSGYECGNESALLSKPKIGTGKGWFSMTTPSVGLVLLGPSLAQHGCFGNKPKTRNLSETAPRISKLRWTHIPVFLSALGSSRRLRS